MIYKIIYTMFQYQSHHQCLLTSNKVPSFSLFLTHLLFLPLWQHIGLLKYGSLLLIVVESIVGYLSISLLYTTDYYICTQIIYQDNLIPLCFISITTTTNYFILFHLLFILWGQGYLGIILSNILLNLQILIDSDH